MTPEALKREGRIPVVVLLALYLLLSTYFPLEARGELPPECFRPDGKVDLAICEQIVSHHSDIPLEELEGGYWGVFGLYIDRLHRLQDLNVGENLHGKLWRTSTSFMQGAVRQKAEKLGLNPDSYIGGIALDSCAYIGRTAWIQQIDEQENSTGPVIGPLLVSDCAAFYHAKERVCVAGTVGEISNAIAEQYGIDPQKTYRVYTRDIGTLEPPNTEGATSVNYPQAYLKAIESHC